MGCDFAGTLRSQIASCFLAISNRCNYNFAIWASQRRHTPAILVESEGGNGPKSSQKLTIQRFSEIRFPGLFSCPFFFLPPLLTTPLPPLLSAPFWPLSPHRKVLCSVERRAQHRAWRGTVSGWTSPQSSGRKILPEIWRF